VDSTQGFTLWTLKMFPWHVLQSQFQALRFSLKAAFAHSPLAAQSQRHGKKFFRCHPFYCSPPPPKKRKSLFASRPLLKKPDLDNPLHPRAARVLKEQNRSSTLSRQFGELLSQAGLIDKRPHRSRGIGRSARREVSSLSFHCLRRTATTLLHEYGVAGAVAQALIGHDSAQTHEDYISVGREALRKAAAVLPTI
jgi:hypothetical protein